MFMHAPNPLYRLFAHSRPVFFLTTIFPSLPHFAIHPFLFRRFPFSERTDHMTNSTDLNPKTEALNTYNARLKIQKQDDQILSPNNNSGSAIINLETGEITRVEPDERICKRKIPKKHKAPPDKYWYFNPSDKFIKLWDSMFKVLIDTRLTGNEYNILLYLAQYVSYGSCVVMRSGQYITTENISHDCNTCMDSVKNALKSLRDAGIIATAKTGNYNMYIINPFVLCPGRSCNKTLLDTFKHTPQFQRLYITALQNRMLKTSDDRIIFPTKAKFVKLWTSVLPHILDLRLSGAEITVLLACLANLRYESCEVAYMNGKPIDAKGLAAYTGLSVKTVYKAINRLEIYDLLNVENGVYVVSPFLAIRGNKVYCEAADKFADKE